MVAKPFGGKAPRYLPNPSAAPGNVGGSPYIPEVDTSPAAIPDYFDKDGIYPCARTTPHGWYVYYHAADGPVAFMDYNIFNGLTTWTAYDTRQPKVHLKPGDFVKVLNYCDGR